MATRYLQVTKARARAEAARIFARYEQQERQARGLRGDQALDTRAGAPLPASQAITTRYCEPVEIDDADLAALPLDDWALEQQGRGGVDVRGHVDESELDARVRQRLERDRPGAPSGSPLGGGNPRGGNRSNP